MSAKSSSKTTIELFFESGAGKKYVDDILSGKRNVIIDLDEFIKATCLFVNSEEEL